MITPQEPDCEVRTPATRISKACLAPDLGKSSLEHSSCNWSRDRESNFSGVNCFASWFRCKNKRCLLSRIEPDFFTPNTVRTLPKSLFKIEPIFSGEKSHSSKTSSAINFARRTSTEPFLEIPCWAQISFRRSSLA